MEFFRVNPVYPVCKECKTVAKIFKYIKIVVYYEIKLYGFQSEISLGIIENY